ncbi:MAG: PPC domain-containing protein [Planctomycetes bacterium]|nr:PPC domain-containing protein [Planctomycetota bacterium]
MRALLVLAQLALLGAPLARAASPQLDTVLPRGGQRGTTVEVTLRGQRLADAEDLVLYGPGLRVEAFKAVNARTARATLAIAPDCPLGEHALRLRTRSGLSELRTFWVGALRQVNEEEPNDDPAQAQAVGLEVTVEGAIGPGDLDAFAFDGQAGQRVTAEVEAMRLGGPVFDPVLVLLDPDGAVLAETDDAPLLGQDALVSVVLPRDGRYVVTVREATWQGNDRHRYRLHLGTFPRPVAAFPPGGRPGEEALLELLGDPAGVTSGRLVVPAPGPDGAAALFVEDARGVTPSPLWLRATDLPVALEVEPNDRRRATEVTLPAALHGRLAAPGDQDWFRFAAKKGERLRVRAFARALGSPLDPVLDLYVAGGRRIGGNDDAGGRPDSDFAIAIPDDGRYELRVRDFLERGGPTHVYRVEVAPATPALTLDLATYGRNSQARNALAVPAGNRMAVLVRVGREAAPGPTAVDLEGLPPEVASVHTAVCAGEIATVPVVVEAAAGAPRGAWLARLVGASTQRPEVQGELLQTVPLTFGAPNDAVYWTRQVDRLAVAVGDPAPFRVRLVEPRAPLVRNGAADLTVLVERDEGFTAPVLVSLLQDSPGTGSRKDVRVDKDRAAIHVTANGQAALGRWPLVVVARADVQGELWVSSQLASLEVAAPAVRLTLARAAGEQGAVVEVAAEVHVDRPFEGEATAHLIGLPPHCAAPPVTFTAEAKALRFQVTVGPQARVGRHRNLFCRVLVPAAGEQVVHHQGYGGELRVDPPAPTAAAPPPPPPAEGRPLSRLEQLRAEHAARKAAAEAAAGEAP